MTVRAVFAGRPIMERVKAPIAVRLTSARNGGLNRGNMPLSRLFSEIMRAIPAFFRSLPDDCGFAKMIAE